MTPTSLSLQWLIVFALVVAAAVIVLIKAIKFMRGAIKDDPDDESGCLCSGCSLADACAKKKIVDAQRTDTPTDQ